MIYSRASIFLFSTILAIFAIACSQQESDQAAVPSTDGAAAPSTDQAAAASKEKSSALPRTASIAGAGVFFISPADGDTLANPITVEFGIEGMDVVKAGENAPQSGHHHLIIDAGLPDLGLPIPANEHYVHFGDASTSTELNLGPGAHTLQLLLGDYLHIPHDPPVLSEPITVIVE